MKTDDMNIEALEQMINAIKDNKIEVTGIRIKDAPYMHSMQGCLREGEFIVTYRQLPKKTVKSQQEIYDELYNDHYSSEMYDFEENNRFVSGEDIDSITRKATQYAVENTVKVWREQYAL